MAKPDKSTAQLTLSLNAEDNVSKTTEKVEKRITKYERALKIARQATSAVTKGTAKAFTDFSVAAVNSLMMLQDQIVNPLKGLIMGFSQIGFSLETLARNARVSVELLGALGFAAEQMGAKTENVAAALQTMEDKFTEASRGSIEAMTEIHGAVGRTYEQLKNLSPEEKFLKIADIIKDTTNMADKADIARRIFGSDDLLPLLMLGSEQIKKMMEEGRKLGGIVDDESVQKSKELAQAFSRISAILAGMKTEFLTELSDSILENLECLRVFLITAKTFIQENPELVKSIAMTTGAIIAAVTAGLTLIPVVMGLNTAISAGTALLTAFLNPWLLIPGAIVGGLAAFAHFTGGLEDLNLSIRNFFSGMLDEVGASSTSVSEIILAGWFKVQEGFIKIVQGMKSLWTEALASIFTKWNSFQKKFQHGVNWIYGKISGLSDEEIRQMTVITDQHFDRNAADMEAKKNAALLQNARVEDEAISSLKRSIQEKIQAARKERDAEKKLKIEMKEQKIQDARQNLTLSTNDPSNPNYVSGAEGGGAAPWLRKMVQDSSRGTQNSFQAMFGTGQTTEQKQLEVSRQIFQILQLIQAEGAF